MSAVTQPATSPKPAGTGRNSYIDTLRGWSILGVVCIHFAGSFVTTDKFAWSPSFYLGLTLNQVFNFAVPVFVFLSGLLAGFSRSQASLGEYYLSRFWRIVFPYLVASLVAFFLLNHYAEWQAQPDFRARLSWLTLRLFFYGMEPTLYFIPLIIQLYILQPALKALPQWAHRLIPVLSPNWHALILMLLLLALHAIIGIKCNQGSLNYYVWARPNALFWMVYFFAGLHFRSILTFASTRVLRAGAGVALLFAAGVMIWNGFHLLDRTIVGAHFELNRLDFAYVRPELMLYDLAIVVGLASGVALGWSPRPGAVSFLGRYTLEIYLWHIIVLYEGAWRYPATLASCRQMPELIVIICMATCFLIAASTDTLSRLRSFARNHRLVLVKVE